jgi:hypothetical protein
MERGKNSFKRKFKINGSGLSENRTTLLEVSCAPNFHSPFHLHQGEARNVPFGSAFIMNVHWMHIQSLGSWP